MAGGVLAKDFLFSPGVYLKVLSMSSVWVFDDVNERRKESAWIPGVRVPGLFSQGEGGYVERSLSLHDEKDFRFTCSYVG